MTWISQINEFVWQSDNLVSVSHKELEDLDFTYERI